MKGMKMFSLVMAIVAGGIAPIVGLGLPVKTPTEKIEFVESEGLEITASPKFPAMICTAKPTVNCDIVAVADDNN